MKEWSELTQDEKIDRLADAVVGLQYAHRRTHDPIPGYEVLNVELDTRKWYGVG